MNKKYFWIRKEK